MQISCALDFKGNKIYIAISVKKELKELINWYMAILNIVFNWTDKNLRTKNAQLFWKNSPAAHCFFSTYHVLKTMFELSRIKLHRNDLKGNKNYFELAEGSSYRG